MKAYDIYKRTCAIMFEREGEDKSFAENFIGVLNALICEALPYENAHRASRGIKELGAAPQIRSTDEEVDMCEGICAIALPYGVASYFDQDDGEGYKSAAYRERFISALNEAARYSFSDITDVYGGEGI